jgi:GlpG protein
MRLIAEFSTEKEASALADHLEVGGVEVTLREGDSFSVWVLDDDLVEKAEELLASYDDKTDHAQAAASIRKKREEDAKPKMTLRTRPSREVPTGSATIGLIIVCVVVGLVSGMGDTNTAIIRELLVVPVFEEFGQLMAPVDLVWDQPWRLLTPMFIHFGFMHLVFNMFWLYHFGNQIEANHGTRRFLLLVAASMIPGAIAQFELTGPLFGGMSGVNYGLFGFVWMQARYARRGYGIETREVVLLMGWLLLCTTGLVGPVANACHAVGLAVGLLAGLPAYLHFRSSHNTEVAFAKGSWADLNVVGWARFQKQFVEPYAPFWFLVIALGVLLIDVT